MCARHLLMITLANQNSSASAKIAVLRRFLGHEMLTGTVRHVFYVQIGNTTIRRRTELIGDVAIEIVRVFKLS